MTFELLRSNQINTSTQLVVNDNTTSAANVFLSDVRYQAYSANLSSDAGTAYSMRINFDATTLIDRIALVEHNAKSFLFFYNGATANTFPLTGADTTVSDYITNSATSQFFRFTPTYVTSVTLNMRATMVADQNKAIGYLAIADVLTDFDGYVPPAQGYEPMLNDTSVVHRMSDGGTRIHSIADRWSAKIAFDFVPQSVRDDLAEIYRNHEDMIFVPFGTATGWDGHIFPCVWQGPFSFYRYSDNASEAGYSGTIDLAETTF